VYLVWKLCPSVRLYGIVAAGGIFSSVSSAATVQELSRLIKLAPSDLVVCNPDTQSVALKAAKECGIAETRVLVIDAPNATLLDNSRERFGVAMKCWIGEG